MSSLLILHEIMHRIKIRESLPQLPRPCDHFHLIGGNSTGGLIALMLGRLKINTEEALKTYNDLAKAIFGWRNRKWGLGPFRDRESMFKATTLESKVKEIVAAHCSTPQLLDAANNTQRGKSFVCAMFPDDTVEPQLFRSYSVSDNAMPDCMIWEAARATTAAPTVFESITIESHAGTPFSYFDAGLRYNNPAKVVLREAKVIFGGSTRIGCFLSIRTGHQGKIRLQKPNLLQRFQLPTHLIDNLKKIVIDCEGTAREFKNLFQKPPHPYHRLDVKHGAKDISLAE